MNGDRVPRAAVRLLPRHRRELGEALLAELSVVPAGGRRLAWLAGALWFVLRENAPRVTGYVAGTGAAVTALVVVDRLGTSDDSAQVSLLVLLVGAAALGFAAPCWAWLSGLVTGSAIAVAELVAPPAHDPAGATLFALVVPALAGAYAGAGTAWLMRRATPRR